MDVTPCSSEPSLERTGSHFLRVTSPLYLNSSTSKHFEVLSSFQNRIPKTVEHSYMRSSSD